MERTVKEWIALDNEIKTTNERLKQLRDRRGILQQDIVHYTATKGVSQIEMNDITLKTHTTKTSQPISLKYIDTCLRRIIKEEEHIQKIMKFIRDNREVKEAVEIKQV